MSLLSRRLISQEKPENARAKKRISLAVSTRFHSSRSSAKNIPLFVFSERCLPLSHPASCRGAYASSRYVEAGCDGRGGGARRAAPVRTAKSCGPGAPTQALKSLVSMSPTTDGGNQAWSPGRARRKPLKPVAQGGPGYPAGPVVTAACVFCCTRAMGISRYPAFPAPSRCSGGTCLPHHSGAMRRENADHCLPGYWKRWAV